MHTPRAQVHCYQSEAIRPEEKKPQLIKPSPKYILIDASIFILRIPVVQRWRDLQAHQKDINQLSFVQWDQPNKSGPSEHSHYSTQPISSYSLLQSFGHSEGEHFSAAAIESSHKSPYASSHSLGFTKFFTMKWMGFFKECASLFIIKNYISTGILSGTDLSHET